MYSDSGLGLTPTKRDRNTPASYRMHIGTASMNCDSTSGGVTTAATTKAPTMT
ncbi:hypothetical protein D3C83_23160 [compost metagenome]